MVARLRDNERQTWRVGKLTGCDRDPQFPEERWFIEKSCGAICQVYDAPDPGEGWRLIDTASEEPQDGDEIYDPSTRQWTKRLSLFTPNVLSINRRRITPAVTYVPFTWEDREQLRGRWVYRDNQELGLVNFDNSDGFHANGVHVENLCKYWKFLDTGKPVGKEVTQ